MRRMLTRRFTSYFSLHSLEADTFPKDRPFAQHDKHRAFATSPRLLRAEVYKERAVMKRLREAVEGPFFQTLWEKTDGRRDTRESSEPELIGDFYYFTRHAFVEDREYSVVVRYPRDDPKRTEVVFDPLAEGFVGAKGRQTFLCTKMAISPCQNLLGVVADLHNTENTQGFVRNMATGRMLDITLPNCSNIVFGGAPGHPTNCLYYVRLDANNRPSAVHWRSLGDLKGTTERVLFLEDSPKWFLDISLSKCRRYLFMFATCNNIGRVFAMHNRGANETFAPLSTETDGVLSAQGTSKGVYFVQAREGRTSILFSPREAFEKAMDRCRLPSNTPTDFAKRFGCQTVHVLDPKETLTEVDVFENNVILYVNSALSGRVYMVTPQTGEDGSHTGEYRTTELNYRGEKFGAVTPLSNANLKPATAMFAFDSPFVFNEHFEVDLTEQKVRKLDTFSLLGAPIAADNYQAVRLEAPTRDGQAVPYWLVHPRRDRLGTPKSRWKCLVKSYGCYGIPTDIAFSLADINYLEDDWLLVLPMLRGGGDLGVGWHAAAQKTAKHRTVDDLEDVLLDLTARQFTHPSLLCLKSNSAGATVVASLLNRTPHLAKAAVLSAPFLDVTSMLTDPSLPLTHSDYEEFGDPRRREELDAILSLCPYSNLGEKEYPAVLVNCFESDYRTPVWQAVKWVKRIRELALPPRRFREFEGRNVFLNLMKGSHMGSGDGQDTLRQAVFEHAFLNWVIDDLSHDVRDPLRPPRQRKGTAK